MKAIKPSRSGDSGAIGIGTMIVFIAMVIVAAVAAAVLINTSGDLQRKSQETGSETQDEVSGNIFVRDIVGNVSTSSTERIKKVSYYVDLAPGAEPVDLTETTVRWDHSENFTDLSYSSSSASALSDGFEITDVHDAGDGDKTVLDSGDRVKIELTLKQEYAERVETRNETRTLIMPEEGSPVNADWTAPDSFANQGNVDLG